MMPLPDGGIHQADSTLQLQDTSSGMDDDIWQQIQQTRQKIDRQREFVRTVADWFWEVDRTGLISFISEEAFLAFGRSSPSLIGEDFISLCTIPDTGNEIDQVARTFDSLFEHRSSFRNAPFYISSQNEEKNLWYISAVAIFDIHTGRFKGFRGSACSQISENNLSAPQPSQPGSINSAIQEEALEEYITVQAFKAVSQDVQVKDKADQGHQ